MTQTLMVVLISAPQRCWQLWNTARGSETVLRCSCRKNERGGNGLGREGQGRSPGHTAPPPDRARLRLRLGTHPGTIIEAPFCDPSRSSKTPTPGHLRIYSHMKYRHMVPSSQASFWPWSYEEVNH